MALLEFALDPFTLSEGFTQSEITTLDNCAERWYLGYNLRLRPKNEWSWALTYGSWIHSALEEWYATGGKSWSIKIDRSRYKSLPLHVQGEWEYYEKLAHVQMKAYTAYYKHDFELFNPQEDGDGKWVERIISVEFEGILLKGLVDLLAVNKKTGKLVLIDHKTAGTIDRHTLEGWDFRFQFMFYIWLLRKAYPEFKVARIMPNAIRKPRLRQGQSETLDGLMTRIETDMLLKPESYFYRDILPMRKDAIKRFEDEILRPKLQRLQILIKGDKKTQIMVARNKNTDHCMRYNQVCPFFQICKHGEFNKLTYEVRKSKHEELEVE